MAAVLMNNVIYFATKRDITTILIYTPVCFKVAEMRKKLLRFTHHAGDVGAILYENRRSFTE